MPGANAAAFENEYTPKPVKDHLTVSKTVDGQELPDDQAYKTFTFTMSMSSQNVDGVTMPENKTATVTVEKTGEANTANFDEITLRQIKAIRKAERRLQTDRRW